MGRGEIVKGVGCEIWGEEAIFGKECMSHMGTELIKNLQ